jgi:hypothetical protein
MDSTEIVWKYYLVVVVFLPLRGSYVIHDHLLFYFLFLTISKNAQYPVPTQYIFRSVVI